MRRKLITKLRNGMRITPSDVKYLYSIKKIKTLAPFFEEAKEFFPATDRISFLVALPLNISNECERRGRLCRDFTLPGKDSVPPPVEAFDDLLSKFAARGGKTVYLTSGHSQAVNIEYIERFICRIVSRYQFEVCGLGADLIKHLSEISLFSTKQIVGKLVLAGLKHFDETPGILNNEIRLRIFDKTPLVNDILDIYSVIARMGLKLKAWINIGYDESIEQVIEAVQILRKFVDVPDGKTPVLTALTISTYHPLLGAVECRMDKSLFAKTIAIIRILLKKLPYLSLNTSGLSKDYIQIAIENGVNDLGIVSLPEMKTLSPFFVGNLDSSDAEALITRLNRVPQIRTASFLNHPGK